VLLVMGLGMTLTAWWRTVPVLAGSCPVIAFDNRGVGRSEPAALPYTVAQMADDAVAVLDAAGEDGAHVDGISLGGMVAEVALRHPERVRALVLGATTPGGTRATVPDAPALGFFARAAAMGHEETAWASVQFIYAERTRRRHADRIAEDIARRRTPLRDRRAAGGPRRRRFRLANTPSSLRRGVAKARVRMPGAAPGAGRVLRAA
jgi:3-oxoadipate enol-lactonase